MNKKRDEFSLRIFRLRILPLLRPATSSINNNNKINIAHTKLNERLNFISTRGQRQELTIYM